MDEAKQSRFKELLDKTYIIIIFIFILFVMVWNIDSKSDYFKPSEDIMIYHVVNKVLHGTDISSIVTWQWSSLHTGEAFKSPIYSFITELGIRTFGFNLFGIRILHTLIAFASLILAYRALTKYTNSNIAIIFILLLSTSPWFLVFSRSGAFYALSLSLVLIATSLILNILKSDRANLYPLSFLAGCAISLLPYGYMIIRPISILLIIWLLGEIFIRTSRLNFKHFLVLMIPILFIIVIQHNDFNQSFNNYFSARGESMIDTIISSKANKSALLETKDKLVINIDKHKNMLLGMNDRNNYWNPTILQNFWSPEVTIYPKFLVPFFIFGFLICVYQLVFKRSPESFYLISFFIFTLLPGLFAKIGYPDPARNYTSILPIYLSIAVSVVVIYDILKRFLLRYKRYMALHFLKAISIVLLVITVIYQISNYYNKNRYYDEYKELRTHELVDFLNTNSHIKDGKKIVVHERPIFHDYNYVALKLIGGDTIIGLINSGHIMLYDLYQKSNIIEGFNSCTYDQLITNSDIIDDITFISMFNNNPKKYNNIKVYELRKEYCK